MISSAVLQDIYCAHHVGFVEVMRIPPTFRHVTLSREMKYVANPVDGERGGGNIAVCARVLPDPKPTRLQPDNQMAAEEARRSGYEDFVFHLSFGKSCFWRSSNSSTARM